MPRTKRYRLAFQRYLDAPAQARILEGQLVADHPTDRDASSQASGRLETGVRGFRLPVADGTELEAELAWPETTVTALAVLSHPHPQYGGDMFNPLIDSLFTSLGQHGIATLRFNFRGVGASTGTHDGGVAEQSDVEAAMTAGWQQIQLNSNGQLPKLVSVGWSFGGDVSLAVAHEAAAGWVGVAAPLQVVDPAGMAAATDGRPKLLLVPEHDQFCDPDQAAERTAGWPNTEVRTVAGADHFLGGHDRTVVEHVAGFVNQL